MEQYPKIYLYRRIVQAKLFIDNHFGEDIDLGNIADEAFFSRFHFIRLFKTIYNKTFPGNPFEYFFADERYGQQYKQEQKLGNVFVASAFVAVLIACMGLFGLVAFSARQRVKEIGIRKVLGASIADITTLLSKDFITLVLVAILVASPIAWWAMNKWLQGFAYRTEISWWVFLVAGVAALAVALLTVSFQSIRAALMNPVKSLKAE